MKRDTQAIKILVDPITEIEIEEDAKSCAKSMGSEILVPLNPYDDKKCNKNLYKRAEILLSQTKR